MKVLEFLSFDFTTAMGTIMASIIINATAKDPARIRVRLVNIRGRLHEKGI